MDLKRQIHDCAKTSAAKYCVLIGDVLGCVRTRACIHARYEAIRCVIETTGCTQTALAEAWGLDPATVRAAVRGEEPLREFSLTQSAAAHEATRGKLSWMYGPQRAAAILAGNDPATQADIAKWTRLGRRSAA